MNPYWRKLYEVPDTMPEGMPDCCRRVVPPVNPITWEGSPAPDFECPDCATVWVFSGLGAPS